MRSYLKGEQDREFQARAAGYFFFFFFLVKKSQAYENALRNWSPVWLQPDVCDEESKL